MIARSGQKSALFVNHFNDLNVNAGPWFCPSYGRRFTKVMETTDSTFTSHWFSPVMR